ncbi:MAG: phosphoribosylformylglycinamidine synthase subunit PurS [Longimicrobiales bacterium]
MTEYQAAVRVTTRAGLLDPEGKAIHNALHSLDFGNVDEVRAGKLIQIRLKARSEQEAQAQVEAMCRKLLANPVTEDYHVAFEQMV